MITNFRWRLLAFSRKIWVRAALYSMVGVVAALASVHLGQWVPERVATSLGANAVGSILQVIAASMLSVTIFALSTLVGALLNAAAASPRASRIVVEDPTAQGILAVFLGVFVFSLVGIIALSTGAYSAGQRFVLFVFTLAFVVVTVASLIRWIQHITQLGRIEDSVERLERASIEAFEKHRRAPQFGGVSWNDDADPPDADAILLMSDRAGYVRHFDIEALVSHLEPSQRVWVLARPGTFVGPNRPLALVARGASGAVISDDDLESLRNSWLVGETRNFDQDPRFGVCVLAEVASKALSPGINDVGTAIGVLGRLVRVLATLDRNAEQPNEGGVEHAQVRVRPIVALDMLRDAFRSIARDGAGAIELGLRLQATLAHVARLRPRGDVLQGDLGEAAAAIADDALARARSALELPADVSELEAASRQLRSSGPPELAVGRSSSDP